MSDVVMVYAASLPSKSLHKHVSVQGAHQGYCDEPHVVRAHGA